MILFIILTSIFLDFFLLLHFKKPIILFISIYSDALFLKSLSLIHIKLGLCPPINFAIINFNLLFPLISPLFSFVP
jgi:hypothetical protein